MPENRRDSSNPPTPAPRDVMDGDPSGFDAAQKSLADALRLSFIILQLVMAIMAVAYLLTGFNIVSEQERGLRLMFGRIRDAEALEPGLHISWPYPIGEFVRVRAAQETMDVNREFWVNLSAAETGVAFEQLQRSVARGLAPGEDGSVITSDGNLAHVRFSVKYRIADPRQYKETMSESPVAGSGTETHAQAIIRKAVERGVVHAAARLSLDEVIQSPDVAASLVKQSAQEVLDAIGSGVRLETVSCTEARPPRVVLEDYEAVNRARTEAGKAIEAARDEATSTLNAEAGLASRPLVTLIDDYEQALEPVSTTDQAKAGAILAQINDTLASPEAGGRVSEVIGGARADAIAVRTKLESELAEFQAWIERYRQAPTLVRETLWQAALARVMSRDIERFYVPGQIEIRLTRDPRLARERKSRQYAEEQMRNLTTGAPMSGDE